MSCLQGRVFKVVVSARQCIQEQQTLSAMACPQVLVCQDLAGAPVRMSILHTGVMRVQPSQHLSDYGIANDSHI